MSELSIRTTATPMSIDLIRAQLLARASRAAEAAGNAIQSQEIANIENGDHIGPTHNLRDSVMAPELRVEGNQVIVDVVNTSDHAGSVEYGHGPQPMTHQFLEDIRAWADYKGLDRGAAYRIAKHIAIHGSHAYWFMSLAIDDKAYKALRDGWFDE
jgi:hypothetical protein